MSDEITQADRELLAMEYERDGFDPVQAQQIRDGYVNNTTATALRAIAAARRQGQGGGEVVEPMTGDLLPCPFCGSCDLSIFNDGVWCEGCSAHHDIEESDGGLPAAIAAWNTRACVAQQPAAREEMSPEFTDSARAAIAWVLYHHQGGSSPEGQPLRFALGMGAHEPLPDWRIAEAKRWAEWAGATTADFHRQQPAAERHPERRRLE